MERGVVAGNDNKEGEVRCSLSRFFGSATL